MLNPGFFLFLQKHFFFSVILSASNHQLVDKMNYIEFTVLKAFTSDLKLRTNPVKALNGIVYAANVNNLSNNLVERVDFSDSRVALYCGLVYKFFLTLKTYS